MADVFDRKLPVIHLIQRVSDGRWFSSDTGWSRTMNAATAFTSTDHMVLKEDWRVVKFVQVPF